MTKITLTCASLALILSITSSTHAWTNTLNNNSNAPLHYQVTNEEIYSEPFNQQHCTQEGYFLISINNQLKKDLNMLAPEKIKIIAGNSFEGEYTLQAFQRFLDGLYFQIGIQLDHACKRAHYLPLTLNCLFNPKTNPELALNGEPLVLTMDICMGEECPTASTHYPSCSGFIVCTYHRNTQPIYESAKITDPEAFWQKSENKIVIIHDRDACCKPTSPKQTTQADATTPGTQQSSNSQSI